MKPARIIHVLALLTLVMFLHITGIGQSPKKGKATARISRDARFRSLDGGSIKLADYEGKLVVLAIWATWCYPCVRAIEELKELPAAVSKDRVEVIALSTEPLDSAGDAVRQSIETIGIEYPVGWISPISADALMGEKKVIPQVYVIRDGKVLVKFVGWNRDQTLARIVEQVNEALTSKP